MSVNLQNYQRIFRDLGYQGEDGCTLLLRTQLLAEVKKYLADKNLSQSEAAKLLKVNQPRISEIYNLRIDKFSLELLIRFLHRLNKEVTVNVTNKR